MPEGIGDLPEFALGDEVEVEQDEGEISVAREEAGALDRLLGFGATDPHEASAFRASVGGGIEGVASIDESDGEVAFFFKEFGNDEGRSGGLAGGNDFAEVARGEFERGACLLFDRNGSTMGSRELLAKLTAELVDLKDAQNMFIRTPFKKWSRIVRFCEVNSAGSWLRGVIRSLVLEFRVSLFSRRDYFVCGWLWKL
jgi:hypothetical protein